TQLTAGTLTRSSTETPKTTDDFSSTSTVTSVRKDTRSYTTSTEQGDTQDFGTTVDEKDVQDLRTTGDQEDTQDARTTAEQEDPQTYMTTLDQGDPQDGKTTPDRVLRYHSKPTSLETITKYSIASLGEDSTRYSRTTREASAPPEQGRKPTPDLSRGKTQQIADSNGKTKLIDSEEVTISLDINTVLPGGNRYPNTTTTIRRREASRNHNIRSQDLDFTSGSLYTLKSHYQTCDTCMVKTSSAQSRTQCPYYNNYLTDFRDLAQEVADILRYGCNGQGFTADSRCCHKPDQKVLTIVEEMTRLMRSSAQTLRDQCDKCPVDCRWQEWSRWTECPTANCRGNRRAYRTRTRTAEREQYGGRRCRGRSTEQDICPTMETVIGAWQAWQPWSTCSASCNGIRTRIRTCTDPTPCFEPCRGESIQSQSCGKNELPCCNMPRHTEWGNWEECDKGFQYRRRSCQPDPTRWDFPTCMNSTCLGRLEDYRLCEETCSCVPRQWLSWGEWGYCGSPESSRRADPWRSIRVRTRFRICDGDPRQPNKAMCPEPCDGYDVNSETCCAESTWGPWGSWGPCSSSTGETDRDTGQPCGNGPGSQNRTRTCIREACGEECVGDSVEYNYNCYLKPCCESPMLTTWGRWCPCKYDPYTRSANQTRQRTCQPDPAKAGLPSCQRTAECEPSNLVQTRECRCARARWDLWSGWDECKYIGGRYIQTRTRQCKQPRNPANCRHHSWNICEGPSKDEMQCCESEWMSMHYGPCNYRIKPQPARFVIRTCVWKGHCKRLQETPQCKGEKTILVPCDIATTTRSTRSIGRTDGQYPSQESGCDKYIICCDGNVNGSRYCEASLVYDSICQSCLKWSSTCQPKSYALDRYKSITDIAQLNGYPKRSCPRRKREAQRYLRRRKRRDVRDKPDKVV
ncbi:adhesion g protein-coupled receptor b2, partial [Plakobranchus ocellatus]